MRISDWSSDVCSSDLRGRGGHAPGRKARHRPGRDGVARPDRPQGPAPRLGGQPRAGAVEGAGHRYPLASLALAGTATRARPKAAPGSRTARAWMRFACPRLRSEEHTSELQSLMRISYAVFCLKKKITRNI